MGIKNRTEKKKASGVEWGKGGNLSWLRQYQYDFARKTRHVAVAGEVSVGSGQSGTAATPGERDHCFSQGIEARHETKPTQTTRAGPQGGSEHLCGDRGWLNGGLQPYPVQPERAPPGKQRHVRAIPREGTQQPRTPTRSLMWQHSNGRVLSQCDGHT